MAAEPASPPILVPPLESGDRLTRAEFHARYCLHPEIKKAELVDGVVYVSSPVHRPHSNPHAILAAWLANYALSVSGVSVEAQISVYLPGSESEGQPDACLWRDGGNAGLTPEKALEGAPELAAEIAGSSASYDLNVKKQVYERAGVQEYVVWQTHEGRFDWWTLRGGRYVPLASDARGVVESGVFPGLRLDVVKLLAGDYRGAIRVRAARKKQ